jgi:hypothetical protein
MIDLGLYLLQVLAASIVVTLLLVPESRGLLLRAPAPLRALRGRHGSRAARRGA